MDDGSPDWSTTLEMCRIAVQDGIKHIVATPHANHRYLYDRVRHQELLAELQDKVTELTFSLGCDFHLSFDNVERATQQPREFALGNSSYVLTELSDFATPHQVKELLFRLHCAGLHTIITHPERNTALAAHPEVVAELVEMGSLIQITADSLLGAWGRGTRKLAQKFLAAGLVSVIASDAHGTKRRVPALSAAKKAASKIVGEANASELVSRIPAVIMGIETL